MKANWTLVFGWRFFHNVYNCHFDFSLVVVFRFYGANVHVSNYPRVSNYLRVPNYLRVNVVKCMPSFICLSVVYRFRPLVL